MTSRYVSPLSTRYASDDMQFLFSEDNKFRTWRRLWIALAKAEKQLGLPITDEQIAEMEKYKDNINYAVARAREKQVRHDVMAHVHAYGQQASKAAGIIHLGATSSYVGDNSDMIIMKEALELVRKKLINVIAHLADFADEYKAIPTLGYTHLQPAQLTTVGKRATLWINELVMDLEDLEYRLANLKLLGSKGATGTQASFIDLFGGDIKKVNQLEDLIAKEVGFDSCVPVAGQTYSRKTDFQVLAVLSGIAQSASKFSYDLRLLQSFKEIEEPFGAQQIGSSAMPYKRNPMKSERITALSRFVISNQTNPSFTAATQWFERTLDDSANKRLSTAEAFLAVDAILNLMLDVCNGLVVYPKVIDRRVRQELPFMATETIMMYAAKRGGDRQQLHEKLREYSWEAGARVKKEGLPNDLIDRIAADPMFGMTIEELEDILQPDRFIGLSPQQTENYLETVAYPILEENKDLLGVESQLSV